MGSTVSIRFACNPVAAMATLVAACAFSAPARAGVYVTGSVSASTSNVPMQTYQSTAGSGSLAFDLGRYVRLGVTHRQEIQQSEGYKDRNAEARKTNPDIAEDYVTAYSRTHVVSNSLDLTLILYEGQVFVPYLTAGGIVKSYRFDTKEGEDDTSTNKVTLPPVPNLGIGVGMRLNRDFTLKFSYSASPGLAQNPEDEEPRGVWDKYTSVGLTYQL